MGNKLKPCPFCGGRNLDLEVDGHYDEDNDSYEFYAFIECNDCKAYLSNKHLPDDEEEAKDEITAIWNKRANVEKKLLKKNLEKELKTEYFLKPCPFCGGNNISTGILPVEDDEFMGGVACMDCDMQIFSEYSGDDKKEAIDDAVAKWNSRSQNTLNGLAKKIYNNAKNHGWWDKKRSFGDIIALCHSELSEALKEYRNGDPMIYYGENEKPEGVAVEMIDCIIRILDWAGYENIDVDTLLNTKHEYNKRRPYRHGDKQL